MILRRWVTGDLLVTHNLSEGKNHELSTSPTRQRPPRQRLRSDGQTGNWYRLRVS